MNSISKFSFYYILPLMLGFSMGLIFRDTSIISLNKKMTMTLSEYYEKIKEDPDEEINQKYPDIQKFLDKFKSSNENNKF